ncbi:thiamine phosphate synthase [Kriegella sp. EG-1]|nr:thiamine phosphate synthase [Flavobacteriaceae bacterium EG-1]
MIIPKLHYITQGNSPKVVLDNIQKACTSGAELVQLRLKNVSEKKVLKVAHAAKEITAHFQTRLIINDYFKIAKEIKADGVHLGKLDCNPTLARKSLYSWQMIGGTAHTLEDCENLIGEAVDYISLGPFRFTETKDKLPSLLGLNGYAAIIDALQTEIPILGVGGIEIADVEDLLKTGVYGIAVSGEITRDFNSIKKFNELLRASSTEEKRYTFNSN